MQTASSQWPTPFLAADCSVLELVRRGCVQDSRLERQCTWTVPGRSGRAISAASALLFQYSANRRRVHGFTLHVMRTGPFQIWESRPWFCGGLGNLFTIFYLGKPSRKPLYDFIWETGPPWFCGGLGKVHVGCLCSKRSWAYPETIWARPYEWANDL